MSEQQWTRRRFLGVAGVGTVGILSGCSDEPIKKTPGVDLGADLGRLSDLGSDLAMPADMGADMLADSAADMAELLKVVSKKPWVHLNGADSATLRFETTLPEALNVRVERVSGVMGMDFKPETKTQQLDYEWPKGFFKRKIAYPDEPGSYTIQEVKLHGLSPGERYRWIVEVAQGHELSGEFRVAPPKDAPFKLGWIADTMDLNLTGPLAQLLNAQPDLLIHGGDFQYMTSPIDSWTGMFDRFAPLMAKSAFHICIGNHEYEDQNEFEVQYSRLLYGQGEQGGTVDYHAQVFGPVLFILLNSEIELAASESPQHKWLIAQLERAAGAGLIPIVAYHRPYFTFGSSKPNFQTRDALHPLFVQHKVPVVFNGHNHCYERFEVDGMTYVMDGGGGALAYNPDEHIEEVLAERPSDQELRKIALKRYGCSTLDVRPDGTMTLTRHNDDGTIADEVSLSRT